MEWLRTMDVCDPGQSRGRGSYTGQNQRRGSQLLVPRYIHTLPGQGILRMSLKPQGRWGQGAPGRPRPPRPQLELLSSVCISAPRSVFRKPQKRNLPRVNQCERSDRDSKLGPCQPVCVLERTVPVPRDLCAECRIVSQDPNLKIQDTVQLPVSACAQLPTRGSLQACSLLDTVITTATPGHKESSLRECFQLPHQSPL